MALALTFTGIVKSQLPTQGSLVNDQTNDELILDFLGTLSGSYTAGGEPLDFTSAAPSGYQLPPVAPTRVEIQELAVIGTEAPGFSYQYAFGPAGATYNYTPQGGAIQVKGAGAASGQGGTAVSGTYASQTPSLNGQQLRIRAFFAKAA